MHVSSDTVQRYVIDLWHAERFIMPADALHEECLVDRIEVYDGFLRLLSNLGTGNGDLVWLKYYMDLDDIEESHHIPYEVADKIRECYRHIRGAKLTASTTSTSRPCVDGR